MITRADKLLNEVGDNFVLFSCEGVAEALIVEMLIDAGELTIPTDHLISDPDYDTCYTRERSGKRIAERFLRQDYEVGVTVICVQDKPGYRLKLPAAYTETTRTLTVTTSPEIEMLIVHAEDQYDQYDAWKRKHRGASGAKLKPSLFCKQELPGFSGVKRRDFLEQYWTLESLLRAIDLYRQKTNLGSHPDDYILSDLLKG